MCGHLGITCTMSFSFMNPSSVPASCIWLFLGPFTLPLLEGIFWNQLLFSKIGDVSKEIFVIFRVLKSNFENNFERTFTSVNVNILTCSQCIFLHVCYSHLCPNISIVPLQPSSEEWSKSTFLSICNTLAPDLILVSRSQVQFRSNQNIGKT